MSFVQCTFEDNTLYTSGLGAAVIQADIDEVGGNTEVRLEGCTFSGNAPTWSASNEIPELLADNRGHATAQGVFCSDASAPSVCTYVGSEEKSPVPPCENSSAKALAEDGGGYFLSASSEFFLEVQQVLHPLN